MSRANQFYPSNHFPPRRRVTQACVNCRMRKVRCDAAQPKCSLCTLQNVDCVYRDAQQLRIDHNTKVLLDRMEMLEERLLTSLTPTSQSSPAAVAPSLAQQDEARLGESSKYDLQVPVSHTANANHVFSWPIVRQLLSESPNWTHLESCDATDVFFETGSVESQSGIPPSSWRLEQGWPFPKTPSEYHDLLGEYFEKVNVFYPLLSIDECGIILDNVLSSEFGTEQERTAVSNSQYALVLMVTCLAALVKDDECPTMLPPEVERGQWTSTETSTPMHDRLWSKAKLILGWLNTEMSVQAAQCTMLASIYMGARGKIMESFHWVHSTAVKVETIARSLTRKSEPIPDSFRRLYWIAYICEGDFISELSITLPSGIARYEDLIPYPDFSVQHQTLTSDCSPMSTSSVGSREELFGFQISTNSAIRRFLNRVNSVVYDNKEQYRAARSNYTSWLMRISDDLWSHHEAIYRNLPEILLTSQTQLSVADHSLHPTSGNIESQNRPWNVIRLRGRYYAGQYIIHRPFIEFALLNMGHLDLHPHRAEVLEKSKTCLNGCKGFIELFAGQSLNSITCLFASGMVIFTMTLILMVSSVCSIFRDILPPSLEEAILSGKQTLSRLKMNIQEFEWHLDVLERVDVARQSRIHKATQR
ncbi:hypothetical protein B0T10DRAFT_490225 [Thelonectria olida]|uniref:Zn(2)-C6 fungal-type domain-containing protein n=1 Tax=Thelonectria olida TaxID=1576542 RepID=A0A9P9AP81_9HYPO|nr:hypothetical protein B0T10DRAFT_490225 [Thelonectria olida]